MHPPHPGMEAWPDRIHALLRGDLTPVPPRPAATVLLLRDGPGGLETYLLRRRTTMAFAGGAYAFPGGATAPADADVRHTALRETLEETGVRLPGPDALVPWARWITPEFEPRRYDTWFFLAALPTGQAPRNASTEADAAAWLRPRAAVDGHRAGDLPMLPPTLATLRDLVPHHTVADALASATARHAAAEPAPVMAVVRARDGEIVVSWPGYEDFERRWPAPPGPGAAPRTTAVRDPAPESEPER